MSSRPLHALLLASLVCVPLAAGAAPCSGFTDVDSTSGFCPNVDWLKNRAVTQGCTSTTLFCPTGSVTRLSMAAFMNRLGTAMTPAILYDDATGGALDLDNPPPVVCATAAFPTGTFPRSVQLGATLTAQTNATTAALDLMLVQSTNGGATWTPLNTTPSSISGASKRMNAAVWKGDLPLTVSATYLFGLRVTRAAASGTTGDLIGWTCQLKAVVTSRTGSTAPF